MKKYKKEIIVTTSEEGLILCFWRKKKNNSVKARLRSLFGFLDGKGKWDYSGPLSINDSNKPGYTVGDLGNFGAELMKNIPSLTKDVPINHLNANFNIVKK
ncbi:hypothetical protein [Bacteroides sp.]|uniref:hypothetical protein n=1 Tax=Bacteroides sp. TaxID=29523 RepID=UPI002584E67E|nr:hypothetical protein [Bacteroides sp.]